MAGETFEVRAERSDGVGGTSAAPKIVCLGLRQAAAESLAQQLASSLSYKTVIVSRSDGR